MDLLQVQEELNIVIQVMQQQIDLITDFQASLTDDESNDASEKISIKTKRSSATSSRESGIKLLSHPERATYRQFSSSKLADPMSQLLESLRTEFLDLCDLRDNSNNLVNRTVQLVNIRMEDHGKAILVFTIVTIIFLPLSFVTSFFGMNVADIRNMSSSQGLFWIVAGALTASVVALATFLAFYGGWIFQRLLNIMEHKRRNDEQGPGPSNNYQNEGPGLLRRLLPPSLSRSTTLQGNMSEFKVLDASRPGNVSVL